MGLTLFDPTTNCLSLSSALETIETILPVKYKGFWYKKMELKKMGKVFSRG